MDCQSNSLYLIYDNECLLCRQCAKAIRIKEAVGQLFTINARSDHPLVAEVLNKGFDLNEGIIVKYNNAFFYGTEAVHLLALLSSPLDLFNKLNAFFFKYKFTTYLFYPVFKFIRNLILFLRRTSKIQKPNKKPIFAEVFNEQWDNLPKVFKKRYGNFIFKTQSITVHGELNIQIAKVFSYLTPLLKLIHVLFPYPGKHLPAKVEFNSKHNSNRIDMNRTVYYHNKTPYQFNTCLFISKKNEVIELIRFGVGVKSFYSYSDNKIEIKHGGYLWRILGFNIPMPLAMLFGKVSGHEIALNDDHFSMLVKISHPILGDLLEYNGTFEIKE